MGNGSAQHGREDGGNDEEASKPLNGDAVAAVNNADSATA